METWSILVVVVVYKMKNLGHVWFWITFPVFMSCLHFLLQNCRIVYTLFLFSNTLTL